MWELEKCWGASNNTSCCVNLKSHVKTYTRSTLILDDKLSWGVDFVCWHLIFVDNPQHGTCFISPLWHPKFWGASETFGKLVHPPPHIKIIYFSYNLMHVTFTNRYAQMKRKCLPNWWINISHLNNHSFSFHILSHGCHHFICTDLFRRNTIYLIMMKVPWMGITTNLKKSRNRHLLYTHTHTDIYTYITLSLSLSPLICNFGIMTVQCQISHKQGKYTKYKKYTKLLQWKICIINISYAILQIILTHKKFIYWVKGTCI